jgi:hypothetical protein
MTRDSRGRRGRPNGVVSFTDVMKHVSPSDPEVVRLTEQANASRDMDGLVEQLEAFAARRLPPGVRLATDDEIEAPRREVRRLIRAAAKPLVARGWHRTETRLLFDAPTGYWADIKFDVRPGPAPVLLQVWAVVGSPLINRMYYGGDGRRPRGWGLGHAVLLWQAAIRYDPGSTRRPGRLRIPQYFDQPRAIVFGGDNAQAWLVSELGELATTMELLCSDRTMRDWLVERGLSAVVPLRYAVLLSHHLGDLDRQTELLERLRLESDASHASLLAMDPPTPHSDRGRDPLFWSHKAIHEVRGRTGRIGGFAGAGPAVRGSSSSRSVIAPITGDPMSRSCPRSGSCTPDRSV